MGFKMRQIGKSKPSSVRLAKNFGRAIINHIKDGLTKVSLQLYQKRLNTCNNCEEFYHEGRCLHPDCGCFLSKKAWWASENCPIGKWPEEHTNNGLNGV